MNIIILGAAGFIGTNLAIKLAENRENNIYLVDKKIEYFEHIKKLNLDNIFYMTESLDLNMDFSILQDKDIIYHLVSTNVPTTSNQHISHDIQENVLFSSNLFDACVKYGVKKVVFISSGGTVYGKEFKCPLNEDTPTNPISSYGVQKITIEKLLYLYNYMYDLDYCIIRLANPYGPYQRPNGILGVITTFTYKALKNEEIVVYGDGNIVRDFIYIDDAISGILKIANNFSKEKIYNLGSGYGTSINQVLLAIQEALGVNLKIKYEKGRTVDVPINFLDIGRYENEFGKLNSVNLVEGIKKTANFFKKGML